MSGMFAGATALTAVPLFNTANVTTMVNMFLGATALTAVPLFNTANVTTMVNMFLGAAALTSVPLFNTQNVVAMNSMFQSAVALLSVPALNMQAVNVAAVNFILNTPACTAVAATGMQFAWGINASALGTAALNTVFTNLGIASGAQTITITGNPGAATANSTIATAKGWTVVN
jgi:surface protein